MGLGVRVRVMVRIRVSDCRESRPGGSMSGTTKRLSAVISGRHCRINCACTRGHTGDRSLHVCSTVAQA